MRVPLSRGMRERHPAVAVLVSRRKGNEYCQPSQVRKCLHSCIEGQRTGVVHVRTGYVINVYNDCCIHIVERGIYNPYREPRRNSMVRGSESTIAKQLKEARLAAALSQRELGLLAGFGPQSSSKQLLQFCHRRCSISQRGFRLNSIADGAANEFIANGRSGLLTTPSPVRCPVRHQRRKRYCACPAAQLGDSLLGSGLRRAVSPMARRREARMFLEM